MAPASSSASVNPLDQLVLHVPLHVGEGNAERIVLVHGFTQSGGIWADLAHRFADAGFEVIAPDLPGHGLTDPTYDSVDLWEAGRLLGEVGGRATYVGYSLGGRTVLHTALIGGSVERMLLVGVKVGYKNSDDAVERMKSDNVLADRIESLAREGRFADFIDEWLEHPVNIRLPEEATQRQLRLRNRPEGLADSLRHCGTGTQNALWDKLPLLDMPVLVAYAEVDTPTILEDVADIAESIGENAQSLQFRGVGHSIPFEDPDAFAEVVLEFAATAR